MSVGTLTLEYCVRCELSGLHDRGRCVHCGTERAPTPVRMIGKPAPQPKNRRGGRSRLTFGAQQCS